MKRNVSINLRCKAHRRLLKSQGVWKHFRHRGQGWRTRFLGTHYRWWALGQYMLLHDKPCHDVLSFLADVDFVGIRGALEWSE